MNFRYVIFGLLSIVSLSIYADIPVVDLSSGPQEEMTQHQAVSPRSSVKKRLSIPSFLKNRQNESHLGLKERIERLERQIDYFDQLQLSSELDELRRTVQDLRGLIEIQGHELQALREQQRQMYADLDKRVSGKSILVNQTSNVSDEKQFELSNRVSSDEEVQAYEEAFQLIKNKQYSRAISELENYLQKYPNGQYVVNAHYWLGELFMISGDDKRSKREFDIVVKNYSNSEKVPDALLKLGMIANDQSNFLEAKQKWQLLVRRFPNSSASRIAKMHLDRMQ